MKNSITPSLTISIVVLLFVAAANLNADDILEFRDLPLLETSNYRFMNVSDGYTRALAISPNGEFFAEAFSILKIPGIQVRVASVSSDAADARTILTIPTAQSMFSLAWSRSGERIACVTWERPLPS